MEAGLPVDKGCLKASQSRRCSTRSRWKSVARASPPSGRIVAKLPAFSQCLTSILSLDLAADGNRAERENVARLAKLILPLQNR
jgi:hypothetical protein